MSKESEELFLAKYGNKISGSESWVIRFADDHAKNESVKFAEWCEYRHDFSHKLQLWRLQYTKNYKLTTSELYDIYKEST